MISFGDARYWPIANLLRPDWYWRNFEMLLAFSEKRCYSTQNLMPWFGFSLKIMAACSSSFSESR